MPERESNIERKSIRNQKDSLSVSVIFFHIWVSFLAPKRKRSLVEIEEVSVEDAVEYVSRKLEDESFMSIAEFLNQLSKLLCGVVDKQDKGLNEAVIQKWV